MRRVACWLLVVSLLSCGDAAPRAAQSPQSSRQAAYASDASATSTREAGVVEAPENRYVAEVRAKREAWQRRGVRSYVFVVEDLQQIYQPNEQALRVVVRDGTAREARSLMWGGALPIAEAPTLERMFDRALSIASHGEGDRPARFHAEYDARYHFPRLVEGDAREWIADDEQRFRVLCFSRDPAGCRPVPLTRANCERAGGRALLVGSPECSGWSIGLVPPDHFCCRTFDARGEDQLSAAQCAAVGGVARPCGADALHVGFSQSTRQGCCRKFVR